jgi:hypothetical protein
MLMSPNRPSINLPNNNGEGSTIAQWYSAGLRAGSSGVRVLAGTGNFSLYHHVQNGSEIHQFSYPMGTRSSFPGGKAAGA